MVEGLSEHLAGLSASALERLARLVLPTVPSSRGLTERALAQRLTDPLWISRVLKKLGPRAQTALHTLARAGVPVARADAAAMSGGPDGDPIEALEAHGLVTAVRTGPGMPTHVAVTPGLGPIVGARTEPGHARPTQAAGAEYAAARRRFELAVLLASVVQSAPRLTRDGRLHAGDLAALGARFGPWVSGGSALERRLLRLLDERALHGESGRLATSWAALGSVADLQLRLALADFAAPSVPEATLGLVSRLTEPDATMPLQAALEAVRVSLLRERADDDAPRRGAKRELAEVLGSLLSLTGVLVLDAAGQPVTGAEAKLLERVASGEDLVLALDPAVAAALRGESRPARPSARGHVQASFEVVADPGCDPALVAQVGAWGRLEQADRAAVFRIDRRTVAAAAQAGFSCDWLVDAVRALTGVPPPPNVERHVRDWHAAEAAAPRSPPFSPALSLESLRSDALAALRSASPL